MSIELKFFFKNFTANNQAGRLKANNAYLRKGGMVLRRYVIMQGGTFWLDSVSDAAKPDWIPFLTQQNQNAVVLCGRRHSGFAQCKR